MTIPSDLDKSFLELYNYVLCDIAFRILGYQEYQDINGRKIHCIEMIEVNGTWEMKSPKTRSKLIATENILTTLNLSKRTEYTEIKYWSYTERRINL